MLIILADSLDISKLKIPIYQFLKIKTYVRLISYIFLYKNISII